MFLNIIFGLLFASYELNLVDKNSMQFKIIKTETLKPISSVSPHTLIQMANCAEVVLYTSGDEEKALCKLLNIDYSKRDSIKKFIFDILIFCINQKHIKSFKILTTYINSIFNKTIVETEDLISNLVGDEIALESAYKLDYQNLTTYVDSSEIKYFQNTKPTELGARYIKARLDNRRDKVTNDDIQKELLHIPYPLYLASIGKDFTDFFKNYLNIGEIKRVQKIPLERSIFFYLCNFGKKLSEDTVDLQQGGTKNVIEKKEL